MVRIAAIMVLVCIERLSADLDVSEKEEPEIQVRSLSTAEKAQPWSLSEKEDGQFQEELLRASEEIDGLEDARIPRNSRHQLNFSNDIEFSLSKELKDYRRTSLLSESSVLRRRVRSQAARRKRLQNQSRKSHLNRIKSVSKDEETKEKEPESSSEKEIEDHTTERREEESTRIIVDEEDAALEDKM